MQHTWHCQRCCATWHTYCFQKRDEIDDQMMAVMLCERCLQLYKDDPVFQLLFKLDKQIGFDRYSLRYPLVDDLKQACYSRMDYQRTEEQYAACVKGGDDVIMKAIVLMRELHKDCKHNITEPCPDGKRLNGPVTV